MEALIGVVITIVYCAIGMFMAELVVDDEDPSIWVMIFWPLIVSIGLTMFIVVSLPVHLARKVKEKK